MKHVLSSRLGLFVVAATVTFSATGLREANAQVGERRLPQFNAEIMGVDRVAQSSPALNVAPPAMAPEPAGNINELPTKPAATAQPAENNSVPFAGLGLWGDKKDTTPAPSEMRFRPAANPNEGGAPMADGMGGIPSMPPSSMQQKAHVATLPVEGEHMDDTSRNIDSGFPELSAVPSTPAGQPHSQEYQTEMEKLIAERDAAQNMPATANGFPPPSLPPVPSNMAAMEELPRLQAPMPDMPADINMGNNQQMPLSSEGMPIDYYVTNPEAMPMEPPHITAENTFPELPPMPESAGTTAEAYPPAGFPPASLHDAPAPEWQMAQTEPAPLMAPTPSSSSYSDWQPVTTSEAPQMPMEQFHTEAAQPVDQVMVSQLPDYAGTAPQEPSAPMADQHYRPEYYSEGFADASMPPIQLTPPTQRTAQVKLLPESRYAARRSTYRQYNNF